MMKKENIHKNHRERMRAKFDKIGFEGWSDYEILEYMLYNVYRQGDTNPIAHNILSYSAGNIVNVMRNCEDFRMAQQVDNVGEKTVLFLRSLKAFVDYYKQEEIKYTPIYLDRYTIKDVLNVIGFKPDREDILMVCADKCLKVKSVTNITENSGKFFAETSLSRVMNTAALNSASYVLIAHNHPSECDGISTEDVAFTNTLEETLAKAGIFFIDHIVISKGKYMSVRAKIADDKAKEIEKEKAQGYDDAMIQS